MSQQTVSPAQILALYEQKGNAIITKMQAIVAQAKQAKPLPEKRQ